MLPPAEILLVVGLFVRMSAVASAVLMAALVAGISSARARGLRIDCGCSGSGGELADGQDPAYGVVLLRDGTLLLIAVLLARWSRTALSVDGLIARRDTGGS